MFVKAATYKSVILTFPIITLISKVLKSFIFDLTVTPECCIEDTENTHGDFAPFPMHSHSLFAGFCPLRGTFVFSCDRPVSQYAVHCSSYTATTCGTVMWTGLGKRRHQRKGAILILVFSSICASSCPSHVLLLR